MRRKMTSIYEMYSDYSKEEIDNAFNRLSLEQQETVINGLGKNLDDSTNYYLLSASERAKVYNVVHNTLLRLLENPNRCSSRIRNVFEYFPDNSKEEVLDAFHKLTPSAQERIIKVFGESLDDISQRKNVDREEYKSVRSLVDYTLRNKLHKVEKVRAMNVFEYFEDYTKEEVLEAFNTLNDFQKELIKKGYGESLDDASLRVNLNDKERKRVFDIIRKNLKSKLTRNVTVTRDIKNIYQRFPEFSKDEIINAFNRLPDNSQEILVEVFGKDLDDSNKYISLSSKEKKVVYDIMYKQLKLRLLKKELIVEEKEYTLDYFKDNYTIFDYYNNYSREEVLDAFNRLGKRDKKFIINIYGVSLTNLDKINELSGKDKKRIENIFSTKLLNKLDNRDKRKVVKNVFERYKSYNKEEILEAISRLDKEDILLLKKAYGDDFTADNLYSSLNDDEKLKVRNLLCHALKLRLNNKEYSGRLNSDRFTSFNMLYTDVEIEVLNNAFNLLTDYSKNFIRELYGDNLDKKVIVSELDDSTKRKLKRIVYVELKKCINIINNNSKYTIFKLLSNNNMNHIMYAFNSLDYEEQVLLTNVFGDNLLLDNNYINLSIEDKNNIDNIINKLKYILSLKKIEDINKEDNYEKVLIKKIRLSYYYELDDNRKNIILNDYFKVVPEFFDIYNSSFNKDDLLVSEIDKISVYKSELYNRKKYIIDKILKRYEDNEDIIDICINGFDLALREYDGSVSLDNLIKKCIKDEISKNDNIKVKNRYRAKSLVEYFYGYDRDELYSVIELLPPRVKDILINAYDNDYDEVYNVNLIPHTGMTKVYEIRRKIKEYLDGNITLEEYQDYFKNKYTNTRATYFIDFFPDKDISELKSAVSLLKVEDRELLIKAYGEDLDSVDGYLELDRHYQKKVIYIKDKLIKYFDNNTSNKTINNKTKSLLEYYDNNLLVLDAVSYLPSMEYDLLKKAYGDSFDRSDSYSKLDKNEKRIVMYIRRKIGRYLDGSITIDDLKQEKNHNRIIPFINYFEDVDKDELNNLINELDKDEINLLKVAYGNNLDMVDGYYNLSEDDKKKVKSIRSRLIYRLKPKKDSTNSRKNVSFREFFSNYSIEELGKALVTLTKDDIDLLRRAYGDNLDSLDGYKLLNIQDRRALYNIRRKVDRRLKSDGIKGSSLSLQSYLNNVSVDEIRRIVSFLSDEDRELLIDVYGEDFNIFIGFSDNYKKNRVYRIRKKLLEVVNGDRNVESLKERKKIVRVKSLRETYKNYSDNKFYTAIGKLNEDVVKFLIKVYGEDYNAVDNYNDLSDEEKELVKYYKKELSKILKSNHNTTHKNRVVPDLGFVVMTYTLEKVNKVIDSYSYVDRELIKKTYGDNLDNLDNLDGYYLLSSSEQDKIDKLVKRIKSDLKNNNSKNRDTGKESYNFIRDLTYKKLSRNKELSIIKKSKLSYYYKVDDNNKEKFLGYYFDEFPRRRDNYYKIVNKIVEVSNLLEIEYSNNNKDKLKEYSNLLKELEDKRKLLLQDYITDSKRHRDAFLQNNQRLVMSVASKWYGLSLDEMFSEGNIGLMKALEKFDIDSGNKFSTYAVFWIRQAISRCVANTADTVRLPVHLRTKLKKINEIFEEYLQKGLKEPTMEELMKETGYSSSTIQDLLLYIKNMKIPTSLDSKISREDDEDSTSVISMLGFDDTGFDDVENRIFLEQLMSFINELGLNDREKYILKSRMGLNGYSIKTLDELGQELEITRERVRQIETKVFGKLKRNPKICNMLN